MWFKICHARWFRTNSRPKAPFSLNQVHRSLLDKIVKECDLGFQVGKYFLRICSSFERLQCETNLVIEEILFEFKRKALLSTMQTELSVSNHFQLWITKAFLWFQRRWTIAVLWIDIKQLLEVGSKRLYHFGVNDDCCKLEYNYDKNQIKAIFVEAVGIASIAPWTVACNEVVRAFFASH